MKTSEMHKKEAPKKLSFVVITISNSKFIKFSNRENSEDLSGEKIILLLEENGHEVLFHTIIPDHQDVIFGMIDYVIDKFSPDAIITTGGTGVSYSDVTIETLRNMFDKEMEGFGEIFRKLGYEEIGSPVILSRATAGIYGNVAIFALPGSPNAVELGMKLILQEAPHIVKHVREGHVG